MRPLRARLAEARERLGLPWESLERDYLLSFVLAGLYQVDGLRNALVFKGGSALRKCYFGDYRLSEDLDFTAVGPLPTGAEIDVLLGEACANAVRLLDPYAPVDIACKRPAGNPHPRGQDGFQIRARFPWHRQPLVNVMVEITREEPLLRPPVQRKILHDYGEPIDLRVPVYALEEIVAEKLRAILEQQQTLQRRGWVRSRARDYYDLWRIFDAFGGELELVGFPSLLREKCAARDVTFVDVRSFFAEEILTTVEESWDQWLGPLVPRLPSCRTVMAALRPQVGALVDQR
jgi:predicted nucleotidyltransferase component of viral defense system